MPVKFFYFFIIFFPETRNLYNNQQQTTIKWVHLRFVWLILRYLSYILIDLYFIYKIFLFIENFARQTLKSTAGQRIIKGVLGRALLTFRSLLRILLILLCISFHYGSIRFFLLWVLDFCIWARCKKFESLEAISADWYFTTVVCFSYFCFLCSEWCKNQ